MNYKHFKKLQIYLYNMHVACELDYFQMFKIYDKIKKVLSLVLFFFNYPIIYLLFTYIYHTYIYIYIYIFFFFFNIIL